MVNKLPAIWQADAIFLLEIASRVQEYEVLLQENAVRVQEFGVRVQGIPVLLQEIVDFRQVPADGV